MIMLLSAIRTSQKSVLSGDFKRSGNVFFLLISDANAVISYILILYSVLFLYFVKGKRVFKEKEHTGVGFMLFRKDFSELNAASHTGFKLCEIL